MNIAPLFRRFDELADAPERIPTLRKVILAFLLHSAVNSREAIPRAATLRQAHENRRRELTKNSGRKEIPKVPEVTTEDLPQSLSDIPADLFDRLGNIASIEKGRSQIQSTKPGKYPLVVTAETRCSSESFEFEGAAAIIPLVSSTGHGDASLKRLHYQEGRYAVGNILAVVNPICPELLRARFIYEYLSAFKEELLVSRMVGTANVSLTVNKLKEVPVPLVSGPVLSRIDELMALCDRLEAQQQEQDTRHAALARAALSRFAAAPTPENLNLILHSTFSVSPADLRKSILTLAVQGKLVPPNPNDEPAEKLLTQIRGDHLAQKKGAKSDALQTAEDELPHAVPFGWCWSCVQELAQPNESVTYGILKPVWVDSGVPTVRVTEMKTGIIDVAALPKCDQQRAAKFSKTTLNEGDLLVSKDGTIGKTAFVPRELTGGNITQHILRFAISKRLDRDFIRLCIDAPPCQSWMVGETKGVALQGVNVGDFRRMPLPLPPLAEQRRIVAKVEQLMVLVDALEQQLAASRATAERLLTALVAELTSAHTSKPRVLMAAEDPGKYDAAVKVPDFGISLPLTRAVLAAEIVHRMQGIREFGQVKLQKLLFLTEYIPRLTQIESHPKRDRNGPHDPELIAQVEAKMKECEWFEAVPRAGGQGHEYHALSKAGGHQEHFENLWPNQAAVIRRLIDEIKTWKTERCERFATLYAAWNDLLIWKQPADDAAILDQVLQHWHSAKQQISKSSWQEMLTWMKREGYVPTGWGRATSIAPQSELF